MTLPMCKTGTVLILGASGKLGKMLRRHWRIAAPQGLTVNWQYRENPPEGDWRWSPGEPTQGVLPQVDAIVALWGVTPGQGADLAKNRSLALEAMALAETLGAGRVLHCSSAAVYSPGPDSLDETQAGGAINAYGAAKLEMEAALARWTRAHPDGPTSCAMRIANVVGADSLFGTMARGDGAITLDRFANGEGPWRSYVSVAALARSIEALLGCGAAEFPQIVNVAAPKPVAMEALARAAGRDVDWREAPEGAAPMVALNTARLSRLVRLPSETAEDMIAGWHRLREATP